VLYLVVADKCERSVLRYLFSKVREVTYMTIYGQFYNNLFGVIYTDCFLFSAIAECCIVCRSVFSSEGACPHNHSYSLWIMTNALNVTTLAIITFL